MKTVLSILILGALLLGNLNMFAAEGSNGSSGEVKNVTLKANKPSGRPHSPSNQEILCEYSDGCLNFSFRYPEGVCELTVTECDGRESSYTFDSTTAACIYVGTISTAHLLITTEYGHSYIGEM